MPQADGKLQRCTMHWQRDESDIAALLWINRCRIVVRNYACTAMFPECLAGSNYAGVSYYPSCRRQCELMHANCPFAINQSCDDFPTSSCTLLLPSGYYVLPLDQVWSCAVSVDCATQMYVIMLRILGIVRISASAVLCGVGLLVCAGDLLVRVQHVPLCGRCSSHLQRSYWHPHTQSTSSCCALTVSVFYLCLLMLFFEFHVLYALCSCGWCVCVCVRLWFCRWPRASGTRATSGRCVLSGSASLWRICRLSLRQVSRAMSWWAYWGWWWLTR